MIKVKAIPEEQSLGLRKRPVDHWDFNFLDNSTKDIHSTITKAAFRHFRLEEDYFFTVQ